MSYDSTADTLEHIAKVQDNLNSVVHDLLSRASAHDKSKLQEPEKSAFDEATPKLKSLTYGSDEYKQSLRDIQPALEHHYAHNSHHPEFYDEGVDGMTLCDVVEMLCDWKAASERSKDGDLTKSIRINIKRFNLSPQLAHILINEANARGWITVKEQLPD